MREAVFRKLVELTNHQRVALTSRGNSSIFIALNILKNLKKKEGRILIPDQGIYSGFKNYLRLLGFNFIEIETNKGIINPASLVEKTKDAKALVLSSLAGFYAEQPISEISKVCKANNCFLVNDVTGVIGDNELCNGSHADILLGSFNSGSISLDYGGFISVRDRLLLEPVADIIALFKVYPEFYNSLYHKLNSCKRKLEFLYNQSAMVKKDLDEFNLFHRSMRGINLVVEKHPSVIEYCHDKGYPYVICPHYERVNEKAISIELKDAE